MPPIASARILRLKISITVTLDWRGEGLAQLGPRILREVWSPESVSISVAELQPMPPGASCFIYAGAGITEDTFLDSTYDVAKAISGVIEGKKISPGEHIHAIWCRGFPGAAVTLAVEGSRMVS